MQRTNQVEANLALHFLGAGTNTGIRGNACAVLLRDAKPLLGIDFGWTALGAWEEAYGGVPPALFITHAHLDHCGGLEALFYALSVGEHQQAAPLKLYCPPALIAVLHDRLACMPSALAEGGMNFWDVFQLIPVRDSFWHQGLLFRVFANRHHTPGQSAGLALPGQFFYSGDTRPIPEWVNELARNGEIIFHDASLVGNPSHSGVDELFSDYVEEQRARMVIYHLADAAAAVEVRARGLRVAEPGEVFPLGGVPLSAG